jgi:DNA-binding CsgD family transcriptional regulator
VLLVGETGVGKSHLAHQVADGREADHVEMLTGARATRDIPFGAVAHLVPERAVSDPLRLLQLLRRTLEDRAAGRHLIVVVDDLDQLDPRTQALVYQLASTSPAGVVATVRSEHASTPEIVQFWKDDHLARIDVHPLRRDEHDAIVSDLLGRPAPHRLAERIWTLTRGNPLFARELVLGGIADGDAADLLTGSTRLRDVVGRRLHDLAADERRIVDSISLSEPLDAEVAIDLFGDISMEAVERRELVRAERTDGRMVYRTSHPLLGELLRADMSPATRRVLLRRTTDAMLARSHDPATALRVASWLVDAGLEVDADLATSAARSAMRVFDGTTAERLTAFAEDGAPTAEQLLVRGEALSLVGRVDDADAAFCAAEAGGASEAELGASTVLRAVNLLHRGGRPDAAMALLTRRSRELRDAHARANIESLLMQAEGMQGDFRRALELGPALAAEVRSGDVAELRVLVSVVVAKVVSGRLDGVEADLERGLEIASALGDGYPFEADQMMLNQLLHELARPDVDNGIKLVHDRLTGASGAGEGPWFYLAGWLLSAAGDLTAATRTAAAGLDSLATVDPIGLRVLAAGVHAMTHAFAGDSAGARTSIASVADDPRHVQPRSQMFLGRAETWLTALAGRPRDAARLAVARGASLRDAWHQTWGAWTANDAVRLGHPELAVELLEGMARESADGATHLFADHARAFVRCDRPALDDIARRYERAGMRGHAAEAHAHAATVGGATGEVARHRHRALLLADRCPGLRSPVLDGLESPLSERESEIAERAATGRSSREIAEDLYISRRTVDNHLGAVYSKLGLAGRAELERHLTIAHSAAEEYSIAP